MNELLIRATVARIEAEPRAFDMDHWIYPSPCGTTMCFAGHALIESGMTVERLFELNDGGEDGESIFTLARTALDMPYDMADELFHYMVTPGRSVTIDDLKRKITVLTGLTFDAQDAPVAVDALELVAA